MSSANCYGVSATYATVALAAYAEPFRASSVPSGRKRTMGASFAKPVGAPFEAPTTAPDRAGGRACDELDAELPGPRRETAARPGAVQRGLAGVWSGVLETARLELTLGRVGEAADVVEPSHAALLGAESEGLCKELEGLAGRIRVPHPHGIGMSRNRHVHPELERPSPGLYGKPPTYWSPSRASM